MIVLSYELVQFIGQFRKFNTELNVDLWPKVSVAEWLLSEDEINLSKFHTNQPRKAQLKRPLHGKR